MISLPLENVTLSFIPSSTSKVQFALHMTILIVASATSIIGIECTEADEQQLATREKLWQEELESCPFVFLKDERGLITSLEHYSTRCQLNIVIDPLPEHEQNNYRMALKFVREGKEVLILPGDTESLFRVVDEKLYVADAQDQGCIVSAYDLTNGKQIWATKDVSQLKRGGASAYANQVMMRLSRPNEVQGEPKAAAIVITGNEGFGQYIAVLDRETGEMLAHKIYGKGFGERSPNGYERAGGRDGQYIP